MTEFCISYIWFLLMSVDSLVLLIYVLFPIWKPDSLNCSRGSKHADTAEEAFKSNLQQKAAA